MLNGAEIFRNGMAYAGIIPIDAAARFLNFGLHLVQFHIGNEEVPVWWQVPLSKKFSCCTLLKVFKEL
jgi:hypothetical protein